MKNDDSLLDKILRLCADQVKLHDAKMGEACERYKVVLHQLIEFKWFPSNGFLLINKWMEFMLT